jgi:hypothetical protein
MHAPVEEAMITAPSVSPAASGSAARDRIAAAERHMYDAETALHAARQTHVDAWIAAAYDHLHAAILEHTAAVGQGKAPISPSG